MIKLGNLYLNTLDKKYKMQPRLKSERSITSSFRVTNCDYFVRSSQIAQLREKNPELCKYVLPKKFKPVSHKDFMPRLMNAYENYGSSESWIHFHNGNREKNSWKMHIYSDNEADWQKLCTLLIPYFKDAGINWKTIGTSYEFFDILNRGIQKGKAITIYPHSDSEFATVAHDLNFIIKNNNMQLKNSEIHGDRQLGNSGRLFYRYEYKTKEVADWIFDLSYPPHCAEYSEFYEPNRRSGSYLADDMNESDDIWLNFNPDTDDSSYLFSNF